MKCWKCGSQLEFVPRSISGRPYFKCPQCNKPRLYVFTCMMCESPQTFYSRDEFDNHMTTVHGFKKPGKDETEKELLLEDDKKHLGVLQ